MRHLTPLFSTCYDSGGIQADISKETPRKRVGAPGRWLFFTDGIGSGIRAFACDQAGVNLLIQGFILLHFIQKGTAGFGLIER